MTAVAELQNLPKWRRILLLLASFLGLFAGLCAVFAFIITVAEAWLEQAQAQWPEARANVQRCGLDVYTHNPESYWIDCSVSYTVRGEQIVAQVHSRSTPAPQRIIWQYPPGEFERLQKWVEEHPVGTPITVHYDAANHKKAVLVNTDMPLGGPRTPGNLWLLGAFGVSCALLLTIARITRPRFAAVSGNG
jgi:hypothetical protein